MQRFDAVIIGGGPAGSTAGILLAEAAWSVAIVEQKEFPRRKVCGEYLSGTNWPLLARLGVAASFAELAGPPVRQTAIFAGTRQYAAPLPLPPSGSQWGQALGREQLDTILLERAAVVGATVFQPARCVAFARTGNDYQLTLERRDSSPLRILAHTVIAAHGSWELGDLPTQRQLDRPRQGDWLAFKAHFRRTNLPTGLMPLVCFAGGYGGMVHCDRGRVSLSCCIRRKYLEGLQRTAGESAGQTVLHHMLQSCPALEQILGGSEIDGPWLSAGVIRPGIRPRYQQSVFVIGNAAGEAHPVVAEGISMAMQSAWLLAEHVKHCKGDLDRPNVRQQMAKAYSIAWRRAFAERIYVAAVIANWASRPRLVRAAAPLLNAFPRLVTWGARLSGKSHLVVRDDSPVKEWCQA
jgi:2-polyprenyl-6-methoxyphenol hydroxylase-like FAD-dependent oxidoreductase